MGGWEAGTGRRAMALGFVVLLVAVTTIVQGTVTIRGFPSDSDLLLFFLPAAQRIVDGQPFAIYDIQAPNGALIANPPLSFFWMALPLGAAKAAAVPDVLACLTTSFGAEGCRTLVWLTGLAFLPFILALGAVTAFAARGANPRLRRDDALLAAAIVLFSPLLWLSFTEWWHPEQALMLALVVGGAWQVQRRRPVPAGILFGLGILTRTTAIGPIVALLALIALDRSWRQLGRVALATGAVVGLGLLPYALFDPNTYAALVAYRGDVPIGNSIWAFVRGTPIGGFIQSTDSLIVLAATVAVAVVANRRRGVTAMGTGAWGVMAIALMLVVLLGKRTWPYYYVEALVFLVVWEVAARAGPERGPWGWPALSILYLVIAATLAQFMGFQSLSNGGIVLRLMALSQFVGIGVVAVGVWRALRDRPPPGEPAGPAVVAAAATG